MADDVPGEGRTGLGAVIPLHHTLALHWAGCHWLAPARGDGDGFSFGFGDGDGFGYGNGGGFGYGGGFGFGNGNGNGFGHSFKHIQS